MSEDNLIRIPITQEEIEGGVRHLPYACPIALAVIKHFGLPPFEVNVSSVYIKFGTGDDRIGYGSLDNRVPSRVQRFDAGKGMKPFTLVLNPENRTFWGEGFTR